MQTVAIAGFISGSIIYRMRCQNPAPSIAAASSSTTGISPTNPLRIRIVNGTMLLIYRMISPG